MQAWIIMNRIDFPEALGYNQRKTSREGLT
jgi:hypothetical protein